MELLRAPECELSVAWAAALRLLGLTLPAWEPDTIRMELQSKGYDPTEGLMAKLLAAQTIVTTNAWTYDHDVFFAFALACDGVPANSEALHHPTPEQICWAVRELEQLLGQGCTAEQGFDPDTVDPAIAAVLIDAGMVTTPTPLQFCESVLRGMQTDTAAKLAERVTARWEKLEALHATELRDRLVGEPDSQLHVQLQRLADCRLYVEQRLRQRAQQDAELRAFL